MQELNEVYIKGLNSGYLLSQHEPELLSRLLTMENRVGNDFMRGMAAGKNEHEREKVYDRINDIEKAKREGRER